jgi:hypothetical protein
MPVRLGCARAAARDWINDNRESLPAFHGAFITGSTVGLPDGAELAAASDLDVTIVVSGPHPPMKVGKVRHHGALLEISFMKDEELADPDRILGTYYLAGSLRADSILFDPSGQLRAVHERVAAEFAKREWVLRRCRDARERIDSHLARFDPVAAWPDQVIAWLFATGVTTHVILVAALRNPTIRLRYLAVRRVLLEQCAGMSVVVRRRNNVLEDELFHLRRRLVGSLSPVSAAFKAVAR